MTDAEKPALDLDRIGQRIDRWLFRHWPQRLRRDVTPSSEEQVIHDDMVTLIARVLELESNLEELAGYKMHDGWKWKARALASERERDEALAAIARVRAVVPPHITREVRIIAETEILAALDGDAQP